MHNFCRYRSAAERTGIQANERTYAPPRRWSNSKWSHQTARCPRSWSLGFLNRSSSESFCPHRISLARSLRMHPGRTPRVICSGQYHVSWKGGLMKEGKTSSYWWLRWLWNPRSLKKQWCLSRSSSKSFSARRLPCTGAALGILINPGRMRDGSLEKGGMPKNVDQSRFLRLGAYSSIYEADSRISLAKTITHHVNLQSNGLHKSKATEEVR